MKLLVVFVTTLISSASCDNYRYNTLPIYRPVASGSANKDHYNHAPQHTNFNYRARDSYNNEYSVYGNGNAQVYNIYKPAYPERCNQAYSDYSTSYSYIPSYSDFSYRVNKDSKRNNGYSETALDYGHNESKVGDKTAGSYDVVLPDGRRQIVTYYVSGNSGFVADVRYEPAAYKSAYEPTYETTIKPAYRRV